MQNVDFVLTGAVTLLAAQAALLLVRIRSCTRRVEPLLFAAFLLFLALWLLTPSGVLLRGPLLVLPVWAGGAFLLTVDRRRKLALWSGVSAGFLLALLLAGLLGYRDSVPYLAFRVFGMALLSALPVRLLFKLWSASRSGVALITLLTCCIWLVAGSVNLAWSFFRAPLVFLESLPALLLACCSGWLIFQDGYPLRAGGKGSLVAREGRDLLSRDVFARLLEKENALARQNRLIASGLLAVGAAHEFKNILAHIKATAQFGLEQRGDTKKDDCFRLLLRHSEAGQETTIALLENISRDGREDPRIIDAARDLSGFFRMVRAAFRGESIIIEADLAPGIYFRCRRGEVEQVLLNLVRNAAEVYRTRAVETRWVISIAARHQEGMAVLEVRDNAGGVSADAAHRLFTPSYSSVGSTGLGLSLSRRIILENEGSLEYEPIEGGSVFRLVFPSEDEERPAPDRTEA